MMCMCDKIVSAALAQLLIIVMRSCGTAEAALIVEFGWFELRTSPNWRRAPPAFHTLSAAATLHSSSVSPPDIHQSRSID